MGSTEMNYLEDRGVSVEIADYYLECPTVTCNFEGWVERYNQYVECPVCLVERDLGIEGVEHG